MITRVLGVDGTLRACCGCRERAPAGSGLQVRLGGGVRVVEEEPGHWAKGRAHVRHGGMPCSRAQGVSDADAVGGEGERPEPGSRQGRSWRSWQVIVKNLDFRITADNGELL